MNIFSRISHREKKILIIAVIAIALIFLYRVSIWYSAMITTDRDFIETKQITLQKQINKIADKENLKKKLKIANSELKKLEQDFISTDKPPVAAARIQRALKQMASSINIEIILEKALNPEDMGFYLVIPVEIGFRAPAEKFKEMLYKIRTSKLLLTISEVKVRVTNLRNPLDAHTTLTVNGFIKNPQKKGVKPEKVSPNAS